MGAFAIPITRSTDRPRVANKNGRKPIVYIAGPMTGIPGFNHEAFNKAAERWRDAGWHVLNPAESFGGDTSRPKADYMRLAMQNVASADAIAVLPAWTESDGALLEVRAALSMGLPVYMAEADPLCPHDWSGAARRTIEGKRHKAEGELEHCTTEADGTSESHDPSDHKVYDFGGLVDGGGYKGSMDDPSKLPLWLVPNALVYAAARALAHGANKYAPNNWRRGMKWSETYSALQRHLTAWLEGEDADPDSGLSHLDHAAACLSFLAEYEAHPDLYGKYDNRFKRPESAQ